MKFVMIFAAVLLVAQAAKVPLMSTDPVVHQLTVPVPENILAPSTDVKHDSMPNVVHQVTVPVPVNVLAPSSDIKPESMPDVKPEIMPEIMPDVKPAVVVEVSKDHVHVPDVPVVILKEAMPTVPTEIESPVADISPPATINPCDLLCTKFEFDPVCATNGLCLHDFPNQCILDTYNCKHPNMKFSATKDDRCQMHWLTKCDESDMV